MVWNTGRKSRKLRKKNVIDEKIRQFQYPCWNRYGSFLLCHRLGKQKQLLASGVANGVSINVRKLSIKTQVVCDYAIGPTLVRKNIAAIPCNA